MADATPASNTRGGQALVQVPQNRMLTYREVEQIGKAFVASKMFGRDVDRISKAITKIMAGQELGMAPFAAMRAIHIIDGNATLSANTMAAMVKRSGQYDYTVKEKSAQRCEIEFYEVRGGKRSKVGSETFDLDEARAANLLGKTNWRNYPKAMMFARCMSNGVRTYAPDVFNGMLVYTPDELGGKVDLSGDYANAIDVEVAEPKAAPVAREIASDPEPAQEPDLEEPENPLADEAVEPASTAHLAQIKRLLVNLGTPEDGIKQKLMDDFDVFDPDNMSRDDADRIIAELTGATS